jgi:integrase
MADKRQKTDHPGVFIFPPIGTNKSYRLAWKEPDDPNPNPRHRTTRTLTELEGGTGNTESKRRARTAAAVKLYKDLIVRTKDLARTKVQQRPENEALGAIFDKFFVTDTAPGNKVGAAAKLAPKTRILYRRACDCLLAWCTGQKVERRSDFTGSVLTQYLPALQTAKKLVPNAGGKVGQLIQSTEARSTATGNKDIRALKTVLRWLSRAGYIDVALDDISTALTQDATDPDKNPLTQAQIRQLLNACARHDDAILKPDERRRHPHDGKYPPITQLVKFELTGGIRIQELWVRKDTVRSGPKRTVLIGTDVLDEQINVPASVSKTRKDRLVEFYVSEYLQEHAKELSKAGLSPLFDLTEDEIKGARKRLIKKFGAPKFTWRSLRQTCATYLVCAPGIWGGASEKMAASQLGHGIQVNRAYYAGVLKIDPKARTIDQAMGIVPIPKETPAEVPIAPGKSEDELLLATITQAMTASQWDLAGKLTDVLRSRRESKTDP